MDEVTDEEYLPVWLGDMRSRTIRHGRVGDVEWAVAAMAPLPSLNAYLRLPDGHPWNDDLEALSEDSPTHSDFHKYGVHGCCGLDGDGRWDTADLRANVDPFPEEWEWVLKATARHGLMWPPGSAWPGFDRNWTVDEWVAATEAWATAAATMLYPNSERRAGIGSND